LAISLGGFYYYCFTRSNLSESPGKAGGLPVGLLLAVINTTATDLKIAFFI